MDNRPIGIFDSGVGGLTAVKALRRLLPNEEIIYFGDSGRMPYGGRPFHELIEIAEQDTGFLIAKNVKALLAACGTTSSTAMSHLLEILDTPIFGVIRPAAVAAAETTKTGRIGVISTEATTNSGAYQRALLETDPSLFVIAKGCPLLAPLTEQGHIGKDDPILMKALEEYLAPVIEADVDTLLLGCTHYPLLAEAISDIIGDDIPLIDCGAESAGALSEYLKKNDMLSGDLRTKRETYYTSGDIKGFASVAGIFLGGSILDAVSKIEPFPL
ncbi:MAG: glutamate racemase [Clostridia bacterium]|nr:glutamate racemase [Clostridia bacterium]